jgi:hypothetical protein
MPMLSALCYTTTAYIVAPTNLPPMVMRRVDPVMIAADDLEAKAAWLAKLDAPAWGDAAKAMSAVVAEATGIQELTKECEAGLVQACDTLSKEEDAKKAWLAKLDVPSWGKAAKALEAMAEEVMVELPPRMSEEEAKVVWLAKLDVPSWGKMSEEEAKEKWLTKLDAPVWGQAAKAMTTLVAEANKLEDLTKESEEGDSAALAALSRENEAKRAWLAKLDVPSWGKMSEEEAKKKWLAKLDAPVWQGKVAPASQIKAAFFH